MASPRPFLDSGENDLFLMPVCKSMNKGKRFEIDAIYQDTQPEGSKIGTVIMIHGAPGSHNDFKYITPILREVGIRVIGVNYPGMGLTTYVPNNNDEKTAFVQAIIDRLGVNKNLVFMGHSRGSENALRLTVKNMDRSMAVILVNNIGFRIHRGVRPFWALRFANWLWNLSERFQPILAPLFQRLYNVLGLRSSDGYIAARSLETMASTDFDRQREFIEAINNSSVRTLIAYSGDDFLLEPEIGHEFVTAFNNCQKLTCSTVGDEDQIIELAIRELRQNNAKNLAVFFKKEGHFLQKTRAKFLAHSIAAFFGVDIPRNSAKL